MGCDSSTQVCCQRRKDHGLEVPSNEVDGANLLSSILHTSTAIQLHACVCVY